MAERQKRVIDNCSYIVSLDDRSSSRIIVFIHGIFGSATETWGSTIPTIMTSPSFTTFDYASFGYGSRFIEFKRPDSVVDMLLPWIEANLQQYSRIYFVAHSMGGLVIRHTAVKLLRGDYDPELVTRIRGCFLIASPVVGSKVAGLLRLLRFDKINRRVAYLSQPTIDGKDMSEAYLEATDIFINARGSKANVPRFFYFIAEDDRLVTEAPATYYTEYDHFAGHFPGSHSKVKESLDENSVLISILRNRINELESLAPSLQEEKIDGVKAATRLRESGAVERRASNRLAEIQAAAQARQGQADVPAAPPIVRRRIINVLVVSCTNRKTDVNQVEHPRAGGIGEQIRDPAVLEVLTDTRSKILRMVQSGDVDGVEFKEGNRAAVRANQQLIFGPDFGGALNDHRYLPAYLRYTGRGFRATDDDWKRLYRSDNHPSVLIMSGMYGLIPATEYIQNYDVHLTDVDSRGTLSIQSHWRDREVMTQVLASHLEWLEEKRGTVGVVVDALSELSYQESVNWSMIDTRFPVLHRIFERRAGRDALVNLGLWIRNVIRDPEILRSLRADEIYDVAGVDDDRIVFETRIGATNLNVARQTAEDGG